MVYPYEAMHTDPLRFETPIWLERVRYFFCSVFACSLFHFFLESFFRSILYTVHSYNFTAGLSFRSSEAQEGIKVEDVRERQVETFQSSRMQICRVAWIKVSFLANGSVDGKFPFEKRMQQEHNFIEPNQMTDAAPVTCHVSIIIGFSSGCLSKIRFWNTRIAQKLSRKILCRCV